MDAEKPPVPSINLIRLETDYAERQTAGSAGGELRCALKGVLRRSAGVAPKPSRNFMHLVFLHLGDRGIGV